MAAAHMTYLEACNKYQGTANVLDKAPTIDMTSFVKDDNGGILYTTACSPTIGTAPFPCLDSFLPKSKSERDVPKAY